MELRHLRYFVAVAETGSLTVAAEQKLHTSQPSLSRQIRDLEDEIGTPLLTRRARGIELTPAGRAFLDHARSVLSQVQAATEAARRMARSNLLIALAWLLNCSAWFLPVVTGLERGDKSGPTVVGFEAFLYALKMLMPSSLLKYDAPLVTLSVLSPLSALSSLLFTLGSPWVLLRGTRALKRFSAWAAAMAFLVNAHWNGWRFGLGIGYFFWWSSFAVLAAGLFDLSGRKDDAEPTPTHAALLPK